MEDYTDDDGFVDDFESEGPSGPLREPDGEGCVRIKSGTRNKGGTPFSARMKRDANDAYRLRKKTGMTSEEMWGFVREKYLTAERRNIPDLYTSACRASATEASELRAGLDLARYAGQPITDEVWGDIGDDYLRALPKRCRPKLVEIGRELAASGVRVGIGPGCPLRLKISQAVEDYNNRIRRRISEILEDEGRDIKGTDLVRLVQEDFDASGSSIKQLLLEQRGNRAED